LRFGQKFDVKHILETGLFAFRKTLPLFWPTFWHFAGVLMGSTAALVAITIFKLLAAAADD